MAGYMTKLQGYVYEGEHKAAAATAIGNGTFVKVVNGEVTPTTGAMDTIMRILRATTLWGLPAVEVIVDSIGTDEVYFVEQVADLANLYDYNEVTATITPGQYVRMHRMLPGESAIFSIASNLVASFVAGASIQPSADGVAALVQ